MAVFFEVVWRRRLKAQKLPTLEKYPDPAIRPYSQAVHGVKSNRIKFVTKLQQLPVISVYPAPAVSVTNVLLLRFNKTQNNTHRRLLKLQVSDFILTPPGFNSGFYPGAVLEKVHKARFRTELQVLPLLPILTPQPDIASWLPAVKNTKRFGLSTKIQKPLELNSYPSTVPTPATPAVVINPVTHKALFTTKLQVLPLSTLSVIPAEPATPQALALPVKFTTIFNTKLQRLPLLGLYSQIPTTPATPQALALPVKFTINFKTKLQSFPLLTFYSPPTTTPATLQSFAPLVTFRSSFSVKNLVPLNPNVYPLQTPSQVNVNTTLIWPTHRVSFKRRLLVPLELNLRPEPPASTDPWSDCIDSPTGSFTDHFWNSSYALGAAGESPGDREGDGLVVSSDGKVIAVKTSSNSTITGNGNQPGQVYLVTSEAGTFLPRGVEADAIGSPDFNNTQFATGGRTIALSGDGSQLFISARSYDEEAGSGGAVFEYIRDGSDWVLTNTIVQDNALTGDNLGDAIAVSEDGNVLVSTGFRSTSPFLNPLFIFLKSNGSWSMVQKITIYDASLPYGEFTTRGWDVALSRDGLGLAISHVGLDEVNSLNGAVRYYTRSNVTSPFVSTELVTYSQPYTVVTIGFFTLNAYSFGAGVALSDDKLTMVVAVSGNGVISGTRYLNDYVVFTRTSGSWVEFQRITDTSTVNEFGDFNPATVLKLDVAISGDGTKILIGKGRYNSVSDSGFVEIWVLSNGVYVLDSTITNDKDNPENDNFGKYVSMSKDGNTIAIGAPNGDFSGLETGQSYIFSEGTDWDCAPQNILTWIKQ